MKDAGAYKGQARFFRTLAHPVRLHILKIRSRQETCVCHPMAILGRWQPTGSRRRPGQPSLPALPGILTLF